MGGDEVRCPHEGDTHPRTLPCPFHHVKADTESASALTLDFPASRSARNKVPCLLATQPMVSGLQQPEQLETLFKRIGGVTGHGRPL